MPTFTTNYNLPKPNVNSADDEDLWGGQLNEGMDLIDTQMKTNADAATANAAAIAAIVTVPTGSVILHAADTPPTDFLECDGSAVSRTTYATLFGVIGTVFGTGDGTTTFNLPDMRGQFARGWDNAAGVDTGRVFGSEQDDAFQGHKHNAKAQQLAQGSSNLLGRSGGGTIVDDLVQEPITDGTNGTPRTASETRPKNVALMFVIKT